MHVFVTGATGLVGRALVQRLLGLGHEVTAWVRSPERARQRLGPRVKLCAAVTPADELARVLSGMDAVVNLAGEGVLKGAWTAARKRALRDSRVALTQQLVAACASATPAPRVFVSASAVGYYGDCGSRPLSEQSPAGSGFLAQLCADWERAAAGAGLYGARVAVLRIGIVLSPDGGALSAMLPAFRLGLGGPLGAGSQYMPWIHLHDLVAIIARALTDRRICGPINCAAPEPVSSRAFAAELGRVLARPAKLRLPAFALYAALGERAQVALQSQRAEPYALVASGFHFAYPRLDRALEQCVMRGAEVAIRRAQAADCAQLPRQAGRPRYVLEHESRLHVPIDRAFAFFCRAENLGLITPSFLGFELLGPPPDAMQAGAEIDYRIGLGPMPLRWRTVIARWQPPWLFADSQAKGPYALWWHEHHLRSDGDTTLMLDRVYYTPPLGWLGCLAQILFVRPTLRAIFGYRAEAIGRLFGAHGHGAEDQQLGVTAST